MVEFGTWLGVVGLGMAFLMWGLDKGLELIDERKGKHRFLVPLSNAMRIILAPAFFIFGIIIILSAK